ncbi:MULTISPECIES: MATE family efflux transporter [Ramlibacter]|uniref:MATE family efflux transporter n=1 Tax=Ramlibacter pinisoli TaxID=2682844 RepID=A0A6N8IZ40_9BURK|nr:MULTISPECIES: MATE family efflux transporter [Ramlibacter]MBA2961272.1 MATE family efflux transporter [Ramlibacter sp. CGMCC 1.13660]MVQ31216.1 MATE family efflux transporter [Ramlibacter pinisoli]
MAELRTIARHAGTVLVGQLATMAFGVADTMIAGRYRTDALAALSVGSAVYISIFVALTGLVQAQLPAWAQLRGAGREAEVGRSVRQALYLCLVASAAGIAVLRWPGPLLQWAQVPPSLEGEVQAYLGILALALPAALLFRGYSTLNQALGKPVLVTWLQTGALAVKVPLSIWLTFGGAGVPALGLAGCAWATVIVQYLLLVLAIATIRFGSFYAPYRIWQRIEPPDGATLRGFARLGVPTALAVMVEVTSFTLMALFIARLGSQASASHQIAANLTAVLYMMPLSLGLAVSARVSYWLGSGDERQARQALRLGYKLGLALAASSAVLVLLGRHAIAHLYAGDKPEVVAAAGSLLLWGAAYHVADALQALSFFVLRSYGVANRPLVVYCVLLWGVGLGGGYVLAYQGLGTLAPMQSPAAFWAAGAFALAATAATLFILLWRVVRSRRPSFA